MSVYQGTAIKDSLKVFCEIPRTTDDIFHYFTQPRDIFASTVDAPPSIWWYDETNCAIAKVLPETVSDESINKTSWQMLEWEPISWDKPSRTPPSSKDRIFFKVCKDRKRSPFQTIKDRITSTFRETRTPALGWSTIICGEPKRNHIQFNSSLVPDDYVARRPGRPAKAAKATQSNALVRKPVTKRQRLPKNPVRKQPARAKKASTATTIENPSTTPRPKRRYVRRLTLASAPTPPTRPSPPIRPSSPPSPSPTSSNALSSTNLPNAPSSDALGLGHVSVEEANRLQRDNFYNHNVLEKSVNDDEMCHFPHWIHSDHMIDGCIFFIKKEVIEIFNTKLKLQMFHKRNRPHLHPDKGGNDNQFIKFNLAILMATAFFETQFPGEEDKSKPVDLTQYIEEMTV